MKYLLDTDTVIDHLRGRKPISSQVIARGTGVSIITYGELLYGVYRSPDPEKTRTILSAFFSDLAISVVNLNERIMEDYGKLKTKLEASGQKLDDFDLLIAATARHFSLSLVTRNLRHFRRISGLQLAK